jgi:sigma-E factor negative regulatory protein RseB
MIQLLFVFLLVAVSSVSAEELTAKQILQKMAKAMEVSNFQGTVVLLKNDKLEPMKYFHTYVNGKEQERLVSLNSPQREIVRNSDEVTCLYKLSRQVIADHRPYEHSFIVDVPKNLDELDASYEFKVIGEEDVAMVPSHVIVIDPKDEFRYTRKIWVSKQHFLPLKAVVYGRSGVILEQVVFTEMQVDKLLAELKSDSVKEQPLKPEIKKIAETSMPETSGPEAFVINALPKGFKQIFFSRKPLHNTEQPVDHVLLSDGFASVSIYLETKKAPLAVETDMPDGIHSVGAINSISRTLTYSQLTVLGEVPVATVKYISDAVQLRNDARPAP